jgi:hypothetical protein
VTDSSARLILDTSAVAGYGRGSINVGETIGEITDQGAAFGVPTIYILTADPYAYGDLPTVGII